MNNNETKTKHTFYMPPEEWNPPFTVTGQEAVHMIKVLRLKKGQLVRLMDGRGNTGIFKISSLSKNKADLEEISREQHPVPEHRLCLGIAWSRALRRSWLLEKASELGAWEIAVWMGDFSQGKLKKESLDKWQGPMISGAKQSLNPWLPSISAYPGGLGDLLDNADYPHQTVLIKNEAREDILAPGDFPSGGSLVIIGPEGGFSEREENILREKNIRTKSLGPRILRWETAALVTLSLHYLGSGGK